MQPLLGPRLPTNGDSSFDGIRLWPLQAHRVQRLQGKVRGGEGAADLAEVCYHFCTKTDLLLLGTLLHDCLVN